MTIRHRCDEDGCYLSRLPDWGFLDDCFGGKIHPCDIDGIVEIGGQFLFFEWKPPSGYITQGQEILFKRLAELPGVTVLVIFGDAGEPEKMRIMRAGDVGKVIPISKNEIREFCSIWAEQSRGRSRR